MVELKLKWTKYCVLSAAGVDNINNIDSSNININNINNSNVNNLDSIIFTIKGTKLYLPVVTLSARDNQN